MKNRYRRALADSLGRNIGKLVLATTCGLVLAGITHLAAILMLPRLAQNDAFSRLRPTATADSAVLVAAPRGEPFGPTREADPGATWMPLPDPAVAVGACAYDLAAGPLRISAPDGPLYQTVSLHGRGAGAYWAVTDRASVGGRLEIVVATQAQLDVILAAEAEADAAIADAGGFGDLRVVAPGRLGFVLVRAVAAFPSQSAEAIDLVEATACTIEPL